MLLCEYCIREIQKEKKEIIVGDQKYTIQESIDKDIPCDKCDEYDNLWKINFVK